MMNELYLQVICYSMIAFAAGYLSGWSLSLHLHRMKRTANQFLPFGIAALVIMGIATYIFKTQPWKIEFVYSIYICTSIAAFFIRHNKLINSHYNKLQSISTVEQTGMDVTVKGYDEINAHHNRFISGQYNPGDDKALISKINKIYYKAGVSLKSETTFHDHAAQIVCLIEALFDDDNIQHFDQITTPSLNEVSGRVTIRQLDDKEGRWMVGKWCSQVNASPGDIDLQEDNNIKKSLELGMEPILFSHYKDSHQPTKNNGKKVKKYIEYVSYCFAAKSGKPFLSICIDVKNGKARQILLYLLENKIIKDFGYLIYTKYSLLAESKTEPPAQPQQKSQITEKQEEKL